MGRVWEYDRHQGPRPLSFEFTRQACNLSPSCLPLSCVLQAASQRMRASWTRSSGKPPRGARCRYGHAHGFAAHAMRLCACAAQLGCPASPTYQQTLVCICHAAQVPAVKGAAGDRVAALVEEVNSRLLPRIKVRQA